jgi:hypothetical protein
MTAVAVTATRGHVIDAETCNARDVAETSSNLYHSVQRLFTV